MRQRTVQWLIFAFFIFHSAGLPASSKSKSFKYPASQVYEAAWRAAKDDMGADGLQADPGKLTLNFRILKGTPRSGERVEGTYMKVAIQPAGPKQSVVSIQEDQISFSNPTLSPNLQSFPIYSCTLLDLIRRELTPSRKFKLPNVHFSRTGC